MKRLLPVVLKRLLPFVLLPALAVPATAAAAAPPAHPAVLSVDRRHRTIELVDGHHLVHAYRYRGHLGTLPSGTRVAFHRVGATLTGVRALSTHSPRTIGYYGRVVRATARGLRLRLGDARTVSFTASRGARVTIHVLGLQPGVTVLVTQTTDAAGDTTITITLPSSLGATQQVSGVLTDVETDTFLVQTADGSALRLHIAQSTLDDLALTECDSVTVSYHQDAGILIADHVQDDGPAASGDCSAAATTQDATGTISQLSPGGLTVATSGGPLTFTADPAEELTDGFAVGDEVDVTYTAAGRALTAVDVEYVEQEVSGTVTAVDAGSVTVEVAGTGASQTIVADPADELFDGVAPGDDLDITYHLSAGRAVADTVVDASPSFMQ